MSGDAYEGYDVTWLIGGFGNVKIRVKCLVLDGTSPRVWGEVVLGV